MSLLAQRLRLQPGADKGSQEDIMAEATLGPLTMLVLYAFAALVVGGVVVYLALASREKGEK